MNIPLCITGTILAITDYQQSFQQVMKNFSTKALMQNVKKVVDILVDKQYIY